MPHFMIRWQFTDTSAKALVGKPHDRTGSATTLVEGFGGKLHGYYIAFGEYTTGSQSANSQTIRLPPPARCRLRPPERFPASRRRRC